MYPSPSRASLRKLCPDGSARGIPGNRPNITADTKNVAASISRIPRTSVIKKSAAAISGPTASRPLVPAPNAEFAASSCASFTNPGIAFRELA
jgi:hypothetical protein